ncbi:hypothetical protein [Rhodoblastus sp.]|uniref:hypothetical protein n=1 Tax=Rhodoblastus sp. TaxID=1962975 RepID=UPI0026290A70|nr:hypothetical protein [Rhodoblastus sp.]
MTRRRSIDFARVAGAAAANSNAILSRWLPNGRREAHEWITRNPRRADHRPGSFKVNITTGRWADFATGDSGGDLISLAAYLFNLRQNEAALKVAEMMGIDPYER